MDEKLRRLDTGFSTADVIAAPKIYLAADNLEVTYIDWKEQTVVLAFKHVSYVSWSYSDTDGGDTYEVLHSHLLLKLEESHPGARHLRFYFNSIGILEVVASAFHLVGEDDV